MRWVRAARVSALVTGLGRGRPGAASCCRSARARRPGACCTGWSTTPARCGAIRPPPGAGGWCARWSAGLLVTVAGLVLGRRRRGGRCWPPGSCSPSLGVPLGLGRYASLGHAAGPRSFAVRSGWLVREQAVLQRRAVVGWRVRQTFFQRRAGLATVDACVGAGSGGYAALDMAAAEVARFTEAASGAVGRRRFSRPAPPDQARPPRRGCSAASRPAAAST